MDNDLRVLPDGTRVADIRNAKCEDGSYWATGLAVGIVIDVAATVAIIAGISAAVSTSLHLGF